ncbi:histidine phosphatase family protein [Chitinophaga sp. MM2321]|uniref:histidine phosphatase family protein n=1 Tax=Chitinophaga sp. MM2321 TaxID=3137178 RepID=UPI0032D5A973
MLKTAFLAVMMAAGTQTFANGPDVTTIIFVNPAEVENSPSADPGLSTAGLEQADQLAASLQSEDIAAIYTTYVNSAVQTVTPLSRTKQCSLDYYRITNDPELVESVLKDMIKKNKGKTIVICGDPENIPAMARHLGVKGKEVKTLYDKGCGRFMVVKVNGNNATVAQKLNMNIQKKV